METSRRVHRSNLAMRRAVAFTLAIAVSLGWAVAMEAGPVRITLKPTRLVWGDLKVPVSVDEGVARIDLLVNGVRFASKSGRSVVFDVPVGLYIRRLRIRAVGYGAAGDVLGEDEMTVDDPRPPFRIHLDAPRHLPRERMARMSASVVAPPDSHVTGVSFYLGETLVGHDGTAPFEISFDPKQYGNPLYARATARLADGTETDDVQFFGSTPSDYVDVVLHQIPLSVGGDHLDVPLTRNDVRLIDNGEERPISALVPARDKPLNLILLIDCSESVGPELPLVRRTAKEFVRAVMGPGDRIAVVGFNQWTFWLTGFTSDVGAIDRSLDKLSARGQTHLYDSVIEMLYELQKQPGRRALVVLTDGVNQGGDFGLDHVIHYARYSGVPIYPIIRNAMLARFMRFGIGFFQARKFAEIAKESGATWFLIRRTDELPGVYRKIAEELRHQYLILFYAPVSKTDNWHTLGIETKRKGLVLRVPRGYFP